jgi:tRNA G18 (ribose-2'-O)-methylase SpoU
MIELTRADDPRADPFRDLRGQARASAGPRVVVEGALAVERLLDGPFEVDAVLATPGHLARLAPRLDRRPAVARLATSAALLSEIAGVELHRGCMALLRRPAPATDDPRLDAPPAGATSVVVVAAGVGDPANLGAIVRCARALGAALVVVDGRSADPWCPRAVRSAMGHVFTLPLVVAPDVEQAVRRLRGPDAPRRRRVLAAALSPGATPLPDLARPAHAVLLLGNEGAGLPPRLLALADELVSIPMADGVDSLNVAAAAAVLLYALGPGRRP